jgi:hypothetical protein
MTLLQTSTLSNQNLSSALLLATYTADAERLLIINVCLDQIAGSGAYSAYVTRQRAGAGTAFVSATASDTLGALTNHLFGSIIIPVNSTDVIKVYATGLAGDTATPDTIVEFWDMALTGIQGNVTTIATDYARRTGDYATAGTAMDLVDTLKNKVGSSGYDRTTDSMEALGEKNSPILGSDGKVMISANAQTGVVLPRVTLVDTTTDLTNAPSTMISDSDKTAIAQRTWNPVYVPVRTLSQAAESIMASVEGTDITVYAYADIDFTLNLPSSIAGATRVWFTAKRTRNAPDSESILQFLVTVPVSATDDGVLYVNRVLQTTKTTGSITIVSDTSIQVQLDASANTLGEEDAIFYDVKAEIGGKIIPITEDGTFTCILSVTRDI